MMMTTRVYNFSPKTAKNMCYGLSTHHMNAETVWFIMLKIEGFKDIPPPSPSWHT